MDGELSCRRTGPRRLSQPQRHRRRGGRRLTARRGNPRSRIDSASEESEAETPRAVVAEWPSDDEEDDQGDEQVEYQGTPSSDGLSDRHLYFGRRSKNELLATRIMSAEAFLQASKAFGPNGPMYSKALLPIPIVLRGNESTEKYEQNFERWLAGMDVTLDMLQKDPEDERRYRQCFAYVRVAAAERLSCRDRGFRRSPPRRFSRSRSRSRSRGHSRKRSASRDSRYHSVNEDEKRRRLEPEKGKASPKEDQPPNAHSHQCHREAEENYARYLTSLEELVNAHSREIEKEIERLRSRIADAAESATQTQQPREAMILFASTEMLSKLHGVDKSSTQKRLAGDYTRLTRQIAQSETAMEDSLAYVKAIMTVDKAKATEQLGEIRELTVSINQDKRQRDASLAAMVASEWGGRREELDRLLQRSSPAEAPPATHDKLATIQSTLNKKNEELLGVRSKITSQLSLLKATDAERDAQFLALWELSSKLSAELTTKSQIEAERQVLCAELLKSNEGIRAQVVELFEDALLDTPTVGH